MMHSAALALAHASQPRHIALAAPWQGLAQQGSLSQRVNERLECLVGYSGVC